MKSFKQFTESSVASQQGKPSTPDAPKYRLGSVRSQQLPHWITDLKKSIRRLDDISDERNLTPSEQEQYDKYKSELNKLETELNQHD